MVDTGSLLSPPNRCWLVLKPVKSPTLSCSPRSSCRNAMLNIGRVGSQSPSGPVLILLVTNCATSTRGEGALTRNSTRDPVGNRNWVTGTRSPGWAPSWELTGTPSIPTICSVCGTPSYSTCRSRMVSAVLLVMRQNCVSSGIM